MFFKFCLQFFHQSNPQELHDRDWDQKNRQHINELQRARTFREAALLWQITLEIDR